MALHFVQAHNVLYQPVCTVYGYRYRIYTLSYRILYLYREGFSIIHGMVNLQDFLRIVLFFLVKLLDLPIDIGIPYLYSILR